MRICHLIESTSGGSVRAALSLAQALIEQGQDVTFLYSPLRADRAFYEKMEAVRGLKTAPLPIAEAVSFYDCVSLFRLISFLIRKGPFDVLHAHSSKAGGIARLAGFFFPRMAKFYTPHAFVTMRPAAPPLYELLENGLSHLTDAIIAVSSVEKDHALNFLKIKADKIRLVPNAIAPAAFGQREELRAQFGFAEQDLVLGFVGRFVPQKNVGRLLDVFDALKKKHPALRLVLAGDGPEEAMIATRLDPEKMRLLHSPQAVIYFSAFDALICSSDYEGFPLIFLEALQAGLPIVTTPVGGAQESVIEGKTGFVAEDVSGQGLKEALEKLLSLSQNDRACLRQASLKHSQKFKLSSLARQMISLYEETVRAKK